MAVRFQKLNARFRAYPDFKWAMDCGYAKRNADEWHVIRKWFWDSFEASDEFDIWYILEEENRNKKWSWDYIDRSRLRIYLNEEAYEWAILKWQK